MKFTPIPEAFPPIAGFKSRKAAQMAAWFASRSPGGSIEKLKLMKLIYLAERDFMAVSGCPMLYDEFFSLPHGPVCSGALNGLSGKLDPRVWGKFIKSEDKRIKAVGAFARDDYDELSDAEVDVLERVWTSFGWMTASQVRDYTHKHCPEYVEVRAGRLPIAYRDVFRAIGDTAPEEREKEIGDHRLACSLMGA